jgi:hypothetical protein
VRRTVTRPSPAEPALSLSKGTAEKVVETWVLNWASESDLDGGIFREIRVVPVVPTGLPLLESLPRTASWARVSRPLRQAQGRLCGTHSDKSVGKGGFLNSRPWLAPVTIATERIFTGFSSLGLCFDRCNSLRCFQDHVHHQLRFGVHGSVVYIV